MFLDKTLLLKGVAGVAAVGGVVGGGIAAQKGGLFTSSSKNADTAQPEADTQGSGQDGGVVSVSSTPESTEDDYGIPKRCNDSPTTPCDLTQDELKKIKFEVLGEDASPEVTVEHFPSDTSKKITLTIDNSSSPKRYTFSNGSSSEVKIKRGETKSVTLKVGKTKFTLNGGKLKEKELGDYGEPKNCTNSTPCSLTADDLEDIKFKDLEGGTEATTVSPNTGTVSLEIKTVGNTNRYIFTNSSGQDVSISKGSDKKVTFASGKKTQFTAESDKKLSKLPLDNYGIPTSCSTTCNLTADDLGEIKFEALDGGTGTVSPTTQTISLKVDSSDASDKRFTFDNSGSTITIQKPSDTTKSITLSAGKTRFKGNTDKLKKIVVDNYGIPNDCTQTCKLTADDLKEIKFKELEEVTTGTITIEPTTPNPSITLTITADAGTNPKIYTFKNSSNSAVTLKKGSSSSEKTISLGVGDTEFKEDGGKLVPYEDPDLKKVNEKIGNLKLPDKCKFGNNEKNTFTKICDVTKEELQNVEFENKENGNLNITGINGNNVKLGIRRLKKADDSSEYDSTIRDGDLRVIFKNTESKITISGSNNKNIIIPKNSNKELRVDDSTQKLGNPYPQLNSLPTTWKVLCTDSGGNKECSISDFIRIFSGENSDTFQKLTTTNTNQNIFTVTEDTDDYNLGYKFTVKTAVSGSGGSPSLAVNDNYEIKYVKGNDKGWGFVKKSP